MENESLFGYQGTAAVQGHAVQFERVEGCSQFLAENRFGTFHVCPGDYVITETNGEQFPLPAELFERYYEEV